METSTWSTRFDPADTRCGVHLSEDLTEVLAEHLTPALAEALRVSPLDREGLAQQVEAEVVCAHAVARALTVLSEHESRCLCEISAQTAFEEDLARRVAALGKQMWVIRRGDEVFLHEEAPSISVLHLTDLDVHAGLDGGVVEARWDGEVLHVSGQSEVSFQRFDDDGRRLGLLMCLTDLDHPEAIRRTLEAGDAHLDLATVLVDERYDGRGGVLMEEVALVEEGIDPTPLTPSEAQVAWALVEGWRGSLNELLDTARGCVRVM